MRKSEELAEPANHLPLEVHRGMIAASDARVHRRGEGSPEDPHHRGRRIDPTIEPRMAVTKGMWGDVAREGLENVVCCHARDRQGFRTHRQRELRRHRVNHWLFRKSAEMLGDQVDDSVADPADLLGGPGERHLSLRSHLKSRDEAWTCPPGPPVTSMAR